MQDVVLIQPPIYKRRPLKRSQPALGLLYVGSYMLAKGLKVKVIDALSFTRENESVVNEALGYKPAAIGITTVTEDRFNAIEICEMIKARSKETLVFAGGPHFSYSVKDALDNVKAIDVIIIGEGDITGYEVVKKFLENGSFHEFHEVEGCAFRQPDGTVTFTRPREVIRDLEELPPAAWNLFELDKYQGGTLSVEQATRAIGVISSRGCPYRCAFCANSLNRKVRYRNPKRFVDELEFLHCEHDFPGLNIQDDSFTANEAHVRAICEEMIRRRLKLRWYCSLRVDKARDDLLNLMKEAGCIALGYGIESGSDRILKRIHKGTNTAMIEKAIRATRRVGFEHVSLFTICGHPGETMRDVRKTIKFVNRMYGILRDNDEIVCTLFSPCIVYPGTELERIARENGNVFAEGFSWNKYYETDKADLFNPMSRHVVFFENPYLSLKEIPAAIEEPPKSRIARVAKSAISNAFSIRSASDLQAFVKRCRRFVRKYAL